MAIKKIKRNEFLKLSGLFTGGILISTGLGPFQSVIFATEMDSEAKHWYGMAIDLKRCIGCGRCAQACKIENDVPEEPFYYRTWIEQYAVKKNGEIHIISENGGLDGAKQVIPDEEILKSFFVPKMCNQCAKSPCTQVCPVGATFESPEGVALVDQEYCIGCSYCVQACPYGCRYIHPEKKVADKCTLCYHRITKGLVPACQEACPKGAKIFGDLKDPDGDLLKFIQKHDWQVLKPHMNTQPKVYYNGLSGEVK